MNVLELLNHLAVRFSEMPSWDFLLAKVSAVLAMAWLVHFALARLNPRWRVLLWRGTVIGLVLLGVWAAGLPGFVIRVQSASPSVIATAPSARQIPSPADPATVSAASLPPRVMHDYAEMGLPPVDRTAPRDFGPKPPEPAQNAMPTTITWESWLLRIWGLGVSMLFLRLATAYIRLARILKHAQRAPQSIIVEAEHIAAAFRCRRNAIVLMSQRFAVPFVCGIRRPVIVLPESLCGGDFRGQLPGVLAHELAHVRSHDVAWNGVLHLFSIVFWFHPLAWRVGSAHRAACDAVCDAVSASYVGDVQAYRRTLAKVALGAASPSIVLGLAMAGRCDVRRRLALLERKVFSSSLKRRTVAGIAIVGLSALGLLAALRLALAAPPTPAGNDPSVAKKDTEAALVEPAHQEVNAESSTRPGFRPLRIHALDKAGKPLVLHEGVAVEGTVTRPDLKPAAGAAVGLFLDFLGGEFPRTKTDKNGRYRILANEPGEYTVAAAADGFVPDWKGIAVGKNRQTVDLRLGKGERIRLRVVDQAGKQMPRIQIGTSLGFGKSCNALMLDFQNSPKNYSATTDAEGRWSRLWIPGDKITFHIQKTGYIHAQVSFAPDEREHLITMQAGAWSVSGRVIDQETKAPIRRFRVTEGKEHIGDNETIWYESRPIVNENGEYRVTWDQPDVRRVICIEADGYYPSSALSLGNKAGNETCNVELKKGENIAGVVRSPEGKLLADVDVVLCTPGRGFSFRNGRVETNQYPLVVRTGADGRFSFPPQNDPYLLVAAHNLGFAQVDDVAAMKEITLQPWARVEGTVTVDGKPAVKERVVINYDDLWTQRLAWLSPKEQAARRIFHYFEAETDAAGHFLFERVQPGKTEICRAVTLSQVGGMRSQTYVNVRSVDLIPGRTLTVSISGLAPAEIRDRSEAAKKLSQAQQATSGLSNDPKPETRIKAALKVLQAKPPAPQEERIDAALDILRNVRDMDIKTINRWATAVRELIEIGKPAVPKLIAELDQTENYFSLQALGFVLRGIGDPRAVPALIRAIPRLCGTSGSDFGLTIRDDPDLLKFMKTHDNAPMNKSELFAWGRPLREILPALEKISGESQGWLEINFADYEGYGTEQVRIRRTLFLNHATKWAGWWSKNWRKFVSSEADAQIEQTRKVLDQCAATIAKTPRRKALTGIPCGPKVSIGNGFAWGNIRSFNEDPRQGFWDLDSGRIPIAPKELVKRSTGGEPSQELVAWAEREGVDLMAVKIAPPGGDKPYYALKPLGMQVWRIDNDRYKNLQNELRYTNKVEPPQPWRGNLAQVDEKTGKYDERATASFLFITKGGICGSLQIRPSGTPSSIGGAAPYDQGGWSYDFIYENSIEK